MIDLNEFRRWADILGGFDDPTHSQYAEDLIVEVERLRGIEMAAKAIKSCCSCLDYKALRDALNLGK